MDNENLVQALEAIIFASGEPVSLDKLSDALEVSKDQIRHAIKSLKAKYSPEESGIVLLEIDGHYQLVSNSRYADEVKKALEIKKNTPLSQAAMEVLAVIAYNQPVSKGFIEQVRGVDSSQTVNNLVEKGLIEEAGRLDVPGRPIVYKTSLGFLKCFGLASIENLPPLPADNAQMMIDDIVSEEAG